MIRGLIRRGFLLVLTAVMIAGCTTLGGGTVQLPGGTPSEVGVIKEIKEPGGIGRPGGGVEKVGHLRILVEGERRLPTGESSLVLVTVGDETQVLATQQGKVRTLKYSDLREGQKVQVWFKGDVETSYPAQAFGAVVSVLVE